MGDPAEGGTPFAGRAGAAERTKPAACGRMRDAQLATATGEDEQGSGASFRRQAETEQSGLCEDEAKAKNPSPPSLCAPVRKKDENYGFFGLRPQNDGDGARFFCVWGATTPARPLRGRQNPFLFPCWKKKRFLGSKEKGAFENWCAVGCSSAACVFTPPPGTCPGRYGLCGRNREKRMFYLPAA